MSLSNCIFGGKQIYYMYKDILIRSVTKIEVINLTVITIVKLNYDFYSQFWNADYDSFEIAIAIPSAHTLQGVPNITI